MHSWAWPRLRLNQLHYVGMPTVVNGQQPLMTLA